MKGSRALTTMVVVVTVAGTLTALSSASSALASERLSGAHEQASAPASPEAWTPPAIADPSTPDFAEPDTPFAPEVTLTDSFGAGATFEPFHVGAVRLAVNRSTGSLLIESTDVAIKGDGVGLSFGRVYDSAGTADTTMGVGWSSSADGGLRLEESNAVVYSASGYRTVFTPSPEGGYVGPAGTGLELTRPDVSAERTFQLTDPGTGNQQYYSAGGYLTGESDRHDIGVRYRYDSAGRLTLASHPVSGRSIGFGYGDGRLVFATDSAGRVTSYSRDDQGRLAKVIDGAGAVTTFDYSGGRLVKVTASASPAAAGESIAGRAQISFGYDDSGRVTSVSTDGEKQNQAPPAATTFAYDTANGTQVTDQLGQLTSYRYDAPRGQLVTIDAAGSLSTARWQGDRLSEITDPLAATVASTFTADGEPQSAALPTGATSHVEYTPSGGCTSVGAAADQVNCLTDAQNNRIAFDYNDVGDVSAIRDGVGVIRSVLYDGLPGAGSCAQRVGLICSTTNGIGTRTLYHYNDKRELIGTQVLSDDSFRTVASYGYDSLGRVTEVINRGLDSLGGTTTKYAYDRADRVVGITFPDDRTLSIAYNADGSKASVTDADGTLTEYGYDYRGLLVRTSVTQASGDSRPATEVFGYDAVGNVVSHTDTNGTTDYRYGPSGLLLSVREPGAPETSADCSAVVPPSAASGCILFEYDAAGRETERIFPGGARQSTGYDPAGRMIALTATDSEGIPRVGIGYRYTDAAGNDTVLIQSRTSTLEQGIAAGAVTNYDYDVRNRLTSAIESVADGSLTASWSYGYDAADNRVRVGKSGATSDAATPATPEAVTLVNYDGVGRILSTTADTAAWTYGSDGNLTRNGITGATRDGAGDSTDALPTQYLSTAAGDHLGFRLGDSFHYYVRDAVGSVVGLFDSSGVFEGGYSYSPFGELRSVGTSAAVVANPARYAGAEADPTNPDLYRFGVRDYDASLGRFLEPDPLGQDVYSYAYAHDDPVNFVDTNGLLEKPAELIGYSVSVLLFAGQIALCVSVTVYVCGMALLVSTVANLAAQASLAIVFGGGEATERDIELAVMRGLFTDLFLVAGWLGLSSVATSAHDDEAAGYYTLGFPINYSFTAFGNWFMRVWRGNVFWEGPDE